VRVTLRYTGLLRLAKGRGEEEILLPEWATLGDALALIAGDTQGYFVLLEMPGERARTIRLEDTGHRLQDGARITLLYRFAGG